MELNEGANKVEHIALTGTSFDDVCLGDSSFNNVSLVRAKIHDVNMSDVNISFFQMGGAKFTKGGSNPKYNQEQIEFTECDLVATKLTNCDLSNTEILDCNIEGLTIDGVDIAQLLVEHKSSKES
jgi:uncharacterized protein YjbI with pentapeptide repeats